MKTVFPIFFFLMPLLSAPVSATYPDAAQLRQMAARFAPTPLTADTSHLDADDLAALKKLLEVGPLIDRIFLDQLWSGNLAMYEKLREDKSELGRARFHLFWISKGPWSDLDGHEAFLPGVPARKPLGANFYPDGMTKAEFDAWAAHLPPERVKEATSFFTVIRHDPAR